MMETNDSPTSRDEIHETKKKEEKKSQQKK